MTSYPHVLAKVDNLQAKLKLQRTSHLLRPQSGGRVSRPKSHQCHLKRGENTEIRQLAGYTKVKKLGVGGCGTVWQVTDNADLVQYALKQIPKDDGGSAVLSALVETKVGLKLFPSMTLVREKFLQGLAIPGIPADIPPLPQHIIQLHRVVETKHDIWLLFERGGDTLHNSLFDIKGEFQKGSRTYRIVHRPLYNAMRENISILKTLLRQLIQAVQGLIGQSIVHADIKPDNILIDHRIASDHSLALSVKLIDFGSSFSFRSPRLPSANTPEYVPPDILELIRTKHATNHVKSYFEAHCLPHSFDMWSVGCVFLEIACGVPLWFSYKSRVDNHKSYVTGLMSASGRNADKIAQRQLHVSTNLSQCIRDYPGMNIDSKRWTHGIDLMQSMLQLNPSQRIAPEEALRHPFLSLPLDPSATIS